MDVFGHLSGISPDHSAGYHDGLDRQHIGDCRTGPVVGRQWFCVFCMAIDLKYNLEGGVDRSEGLFRDIEAPVLLLSKETTVLRANPKADEVFGVSEWMERPEKERLVDKIIPGFHAGARQFDLAMDTRMGPKEFTCKMSNVYQMDEVLGSMLVFHDVTRERELARMKTEFTSTVSHELRTPLTSILGFAKLIERRFRDVILPAWTPETKKQERAVKQVDKNLGVIISESKRLTNSSMTCWHFEDGSRQGDHLSQVAAGVIVEQAMIDLRVVCSQAFG